MLTCLSIHVFYQFEIATYVIQHIQFLIFKTSNIVKYLLATYRKYSSHLFISVLDCHYTTIWGLVDSILVCGSVRNSTTLFSIIFHPQIVIIECM